MTLKNEYQSFAFQRRILKKIRYTMQPMSCAVQNYESGLIKNSGTQVFPIKETKTV